MSVGADAIIEESVSHDAALGTVTRPKPTVEFDLYRRHRMADSDGSYIGQVLVVNPDRAAMGIDIDTEVLDVDFRHESTRPDVPGHYRRRPGMHLADRLEKLKTRKTSAVLVNGNNVGYWANQFAIRGETLVHKERGPTFDDGHLAQHTAGRHPFFCWTDGHFDVQDILLEAVLIGDLDTVLAMTHKECRTKPEAALSGLPVLRNGAPVWQVNLEQAWDPRLVFEVGRLIGVTRRETVELIRGHRAAGTPLARHSMTAVGTDRDGCAVVAVVEQSKRSRGITLAGMTALLERFEVGDAIVLGAAGDAQLATTDEGFLVRPLVARYARAAARPVSLKRRHPDLGTGPIYARPVPSVVTFTAIATNATTQALVGPSTSAAG